ncbi:MazG nucleotide pyrophosphohydrolase domain-containing protein [Corynebacterium freneyi]|uniref:MazG nucleotide pyrophosphohydrolase domain-containing protein n=1 Tax=Corynebacterium freneyi TaxID=134034 RepID=UPI001CCBC069|nr:MazG nucleotide pyrophosphohydrolase domain-containing protein [Corynebacterium freneyi]UBI01830.1 nucleoside triphosphate hydrolase [Corynebacterium freneyi]
MTIIVLDPRFPTAIPLEAANLLTGEVAYTEEVSIRIRWAIADAGGRSVSEAEVLVTTDVDNDEVLDRVAAGEKVYGVGLDEAPSPAAVAAPAPSSAPAASEGTEAATVAADAENAEGSEDAKSAGAASGGSPQGSSQASASTLDDDPSSGTAAFGAGDAERFPRMAEAIDVMAAARRTGEWEAGQTHASLLPYLIEEAFEFIDAVNEGGDIRGELSDLLLQVLFQAEVADDFDIEDVAGAFVDKMRSRKPYLFDGSRDIGEGAELMPVEEQEAAWAAGRGGPRSQPAEYLPALSLAEEAIRRARQLGLSDSDIPVELMCPTPGLELESGCEARTRFVAREFLAHLDSLDQPEPSADAEDTADHAEPVAGDEYPSEYSEDYPDYPDGPDSTGDWSVPVDTMR